VNKFKNFMEELAHWGVVALFFAIPTSRALFNIASLILLIGWIFSANFRKKLNIIKNNPITAPTLVMVGIIILGGTYTEAANKEIWASFYNYSKFLLVLVLISLLSEEKWRIRASNGFTAAMLLTLVSTYANVWFQLPWSWTKGQGLGLDHSVFTNHIAQGLMMSFFVILAAQKAIAKNKTFYRVLWGFVTLLGILSITHLSIGRTGLLSLIAAIGIFIYATVDKRWRWHMLTATLIVFSSVVATSSLMRDRFSLGISEIHKYQSGEVMTSWGIRLHMWEMALDVIQSKPLIGHGTGSYSGVAKKEFNNKAICDISCLHPHNQWLFFGVEFGILGILAFAFYFYRPMRTAWRDTGPRHSLLLGFLGIFFIDTLTHGPLWLYRESYFFFGMMGLLMAGTMTSPKVMEIAKN